MATARSSRCPPSGCGELTIGFLRRLAEHSPLVLVIEDLHWGDATSLALFSAVARTRRVRPLLLVGTFRSDELHRRHPLRPVLAEVGRDRCERVELACLDRQATAGLVEAIGGAPVGRESVDEIHRRSSGNPFFVEELVAAQRSGVGGVPDTLRDVILARAGGLDETATEVLGVVAAAGSIVPDVLADVCGVAPKALEASLTELFVAALLVADSEEVRFRHDLGREVFYDELMPGRRADVHAGLAATLEVQYPERLGQIARHWSTANEPRRTLAASLAAGRAALGAGAAAEAEAHLGRALERWAVVDDPDELTGIDHPGRSTRSLNTCDRPDAGERRVDPIQRS
jgi:predicted ATPase